MSFDEWYNGDICNMKECFEWMKKHPEFVNLYDLTMAGRKLTQEDCAEIWKNIKICCKNAFNAGRKDGC